jgi:hypothetical protein
MHTPDTSPRQLLAVIQAFSLSRVVTTAVVGGLFNAVAGKGATTVGDLAADLKWSADRAGRVIDALGALGVLTRDGETVRLTDAGRSLVDGEPGSLAPAARMIHGDGWAAWTGFPQWLSQPDDDGDVFDTFAEDPQAYRVFGEQMVASSGRRAPAVVSAARLAGDETVLDLGGGSGAMARAFLTAHEGVRVTVGDRGYARAGATAYLASIPSHRWSFAEVDFFDGVPSGYDVYLLSRILHDWADDKALAILSACRAAMGDGARVLVYDRAVSGEADVTFRMADLNAGLMCGGRERTVAEMVALLEAAGFQVRSTTAISGEHYLFDARKRALDG